MHDQGNLDLLVEQLPPMVEDPVPLAKRLPVIGEDEDNRAREIDRLEQRRDQIILVTDHRVVAIDVIEVGRVFPKALK